MKKKYTLLVAMVAILSLALVGGGCNPFQKAQDKAEDKAAEVMAEKLLESMGGEGMDVDIKDGGESATVTIQDEEGGGEMMFGENVKLPKDLDEGVVIYKDSTPKSVIRDLGGAKGAMVVLQTDDDIQSVANWYVEEYEGDGWTKYQTVSIEDTEMRGFKKGEEQVVITIGPNEDEEGGSIISINWSAE
jgi:hypothetical protein